MESRIKLMESINPLAYVNYPKDWPVSDNIYILRVSSCKHFKSEGIRKGGYIGIDPSMEYKEGSPCAFLKMKNGEPQFRLSRKHLKGYDYVGRLALIISFPCMEV